MTGEATALRDDLSVARRDAVVAQQALDDLAAGALAPFISQRDALNARVANAKAALEATVTHRNLVDLLAQREYDVSRVASSLSAALARQRELEQHRQSRDEVISRLSRRFGRTLRDIGYPKVDGNAHLDRNLIPYVRGKRYDRVGSSGAQTLAALAWELTLFEEAVENGQGHPGFLLIDSPQKNLKPATGGANDGPDPASPDELTGEDEAEGSDREVGAQILRDSRQIVDRIYAHINTWLSSRTDGQIIIVDNQPPADQDEHVVVRYSGDPERPPYGLIDDATT